MGCFNTSCFISNQVIAPSDKVVLFPLVQAAGYTHVALHTRYKGSVKQNTIEGTQFRHSQCHSNANFEPMGMFLTGIYSDYGQFTLDDTIENKVSLLIFLKIVKDDAFITLENDYGEKSFNPDDMIFDDNTSFEDLHKIWENISDIGFHDDRIFVKNYRGNPRQLALSVMHKHAVDSLIELVSNVEIYDIYVKDEDNRYVKYTPAQWTHRAFNEYMSKDVLFNDVRSCYSINQESDASDYLGLLIDLEVRNTRFVGRSATEKFVIENVEPEIISDEAKEKIMFILGMSTTYYYILSGIDILGVRLAPQVYTGQDYSNEQGNAYLKFVEEVNKKVRADILEKYGEEYDEDDCEDDCED